MTVEGGLKGGTAVLPGDISSQFVSALLFIAPLAPQQMKIELTTPPESVPYIMMTLDCMKEFGVKIKPDDTLRSFTAERQSYHPTTLQSGGRLVIGILPAGAGRRGRRGECRQFEYRKPPGRPALLSLMKRMGANIYPDHDSVTVKKSDLKPLKADLSDCIDLLPTVAALCAATPGVSELSGIERARLKESDRIAAVSEGLERMGIHVSEGRYSLFIMGGRLRGAA